MRYLVLAAMGLSLSACGLKGTDTGKSEAAADAYATTAAPDNLADTMASHDRQPVERGLAIPDPEPRGVMQVQVMLDRLGFGPGVITGSMNASTRSALGAFQNMSGLPTSGEADPATVRRLGQIGAVPATRVVRIPEGWGMVAYRPIPDDPAAQARLPQLGYTSVAERLAERFHTTPQVLAALNPGGQPAGAVASEASSSPGLAPSAQQTTGGGAMSAPSPGASPSSSPSSSSVAPAKAVPAFTAGQLVRVPNIGNDRIVPGAIKDADWQRTLASLGVGTDQPDVERIVVSKSKGTLSAYDKNGRLVAHYTVTSGSSHDPLPLGDWGVTGVSHNPKFSFDPNLFWDVPDSEAKQKLPPGPNGPVGVVWIDLTKPHYGIHGTSEPQTIGSAESHGCVRLTNWDAARLAQMVSGSTKVEFVS